MGNGGSRAGAHHRRRSGNSHPHLPPPHPPQPEINGNRYVFAAATPYPAQYPNPPPYYPQSAYYPPSDLPLPAPFDHHGGGRPQMDPNHPNWGGGQYPCGPLPPHQGTFVEHQKAVTIRNDVNLKKETLRIEIDEANPGRYLVAFTFDATVAGSITVIFFAQEGTDCNLTSRKQNLEPITISFQKGLGQKFRQPTGTGIDFSMFEDSELLKMGDVGEVYPLAVKAEAYPLVNSSSEGENPTPGSINSQITQAVFEKKDQGEYYVRVVKQILWVNNMRYELQEIYGIGNSVDGDFDGNDPGKECVICLSEPRDTTVLPCRHMCMCSGCAKVLRHQTSRCPICRQSVERLLEIKVNNTVEGKSMRFVDHEEAAGSALGKETDPTE